MADIKPADADYIEMGPQGKIHNEPIVAESNKYADLYAEALERYGTDDAIDAAAEKALKRCVKQVQLSISCGRPAVADGAGRSIIGSFLSWVFVMRSTTLIRYVICRLFTGWRLLTGLDKLVALLSSSLYLFSPTQSIVSGVLQGAIASGPRRARTRVPWPILTISSVLRSHLQPPDGSELDRRPVQLAIQYFL